MNNIPNLSNISRLGAHSFRKPTVAVTYATRNPSDKSANISLSWWNLVMTSTNTAWKSARSTIGKSSGKWYWEITIGLVGTDYMNGVWTTGAGINTYCWFDAFWWSYYSNSWSPWRYHSNVYDASYWTQYWVWDIISIALDMDAGELYAYKNGVAQWLAYSWLSGTIYAMSSLYANGSNYTANFGASAFAYSVPSWYNSWLYS